jgi:hypothetical protein
MSGSIRDGKRHGQGTYTYANGDKYVGEWRDGKRHGQGILTYADGRPPLEGIWEDNKFVRAERIPDHIAGRQIKRPALTPIKQGPEPLYQAWTPLRQNVLSWGSKRVLKNSVTAFLN